MKAINNYTAKDLTLVITAYKECPYLEECIQSVLKQTSVPNLMISTSTPNDYISGLAEKYSLQVRVNPTGGQVKDYNFAMHQPDTPLVMLMHQDEVIAPAFVEQSIYELNHCKDPIISFTNYIEMHNDVVDKKASSIVKIKRIMLWPLSIPGVMRHGHGKRAIQLLGNPITHPTVICVMKKMPEELFVERFKASMDWDLWERLSRLKGSFVYSKKVLLYHRMNDDNQTSKLFKTTNSRYEEESEIFNRFWPKWITKLIMKFYSKAANYY
ncbi:MAG: glycosyltransferase family 2 protein [Clostridiales bacterium]|nr:glycosyltransferase family 2 protein [Clostridiales bacterium]